MLYRCALAVISSLILVSLSRMRHFDQAAVFAESCLEYKLVKKIKDTAPLIEAVVLEYARYLNSLSLLRAVRRQERKLFH